MYLYFFFIVNNDNDVKQFIDLQYYYANRVLADLNRLNLSVISMHQYMHFNDDLF